MQQSSDEGQQWTQDMNQETLVGGPSDVDFTRFLDLGNDFGQFEDVEPHSTPSGLDTPMGRLTFSQDGQLQTLSPQQAAMLRNMDLEMESMQSQMAYPHLEQRRSGQHQQYQQYNLYQTAQHPYQQRVPPTPVSSEMQAAKYATMDPTGQIIFDRQHASFTPLVSPAQTPLENPWAMPDYVMAEDFFSPLTSPAIEAQSHYASTNTTSSPVDLTSEQPSAARKSRRKLNPTSRVASTKTLKSSPSTKGANRRRQPSLSGTSKDNSSPYLLPGRANTAASSEDSVSPETMAELSMRPPPIPQTRTPNVLRSQTRDGNAPATPATLMKIAGKQAETIVNAAPHSGVLEIMDDISLPAAATEVTSSTLPELDARIVQSDDQSTPTIPAKTPKLSADSTPRSTSTRVGGNVSDGSMKPVRGGRTSKKRQSISQATVSPALRPKISPSISPLVPSPTQGMPVLSAESSALYLASKSNYQNIIDGTHLPGVSYPETLAENLSSKRTSHKIAEQGRRNRINLALKEIETLLPASITSAGKKEKPGLKEESGDGSDKAGGLQGASKASTVEMAIVYIKSLQAELKETKDKLEVAEERLAEEDSDDASNSKTTT